ncbi:hypothetical protein M9Y10_030032 [Tritrichomonas musculus]|uniref:DUF3447 domain-containing protein n=1 Tax=Tritrichomonas musculus TaxID=1915356 RepID=A0ABR2KNZ3_9EUKA
MSIKEYVDKMKNVQKALLEYIEDESNAEENYEIFLNLISEQQIIKDQHELKELLLLICKISDNHNRVNDLINKIERIILHFKNQILNFLTNSEIFGIFENNKRILLFLFQEGIITVDEHISSQIDSEKHVKMNFGLFFAPEIIKFWLKQWKKEGKSEKNIVFYSEMLSKLSNDFYEKRKKGENDDDLCELIRSNKVKEFGVYINLNNVSPQSYIKKSLHETNIFLLNKKITLIEYAAFFGSLEIIKYLKINENVELTSSLWKYAIHSKNSELIKYLEDNKVSPPGNNFDSTLKESIKCHHNDVANYIILNLMEEDENSNENDFKKKLNRFVVKYHNYCFFPENLINKNLLFSFCEFGFYTLVKLYIQQQNIDINAKNISLLTF